MYQSGSKSYSDFVEFCDEKYFTNGKKCIIIIAEVNSLILNLKNFFEKIKNSKQN